MKISRTNCNFEREPLLSPFGFKGGYVTEVWQNFVLLENAAGRQGLGLGTQSTLWSDADVFTSFSESAGNSVMFLMTSFAAKKAMEIDWETPMDLLDEVLPATYAYGKTITGNKNLRLTFALNALVAVDNAAWQLYCNEQNITNFDDLVPADIKPALSLRHPRLACIPLMTYGVPIEDISKAVEQGYFFLKVKIGPDPDKDGNLDKMLEWDKDRLAAIHKAVKDIEIPYTDTGRIPYYLDANGRYDNKDRLMKLLRYAERIGALERIIIMEEPFPEQYKIDVSDIPVRLAADESAHSDKDTIERIELGYSAIALKPIAKTMSMSLKIARIAHEKNIPCFCADLTVNPILVDWNKNVAARLASLPGMKIGVLESNGHQNYKNWQAMKTYHPCYGSSWMETQQGLFELTDDFYARSGGIFEISEHYKDLA
ncbi:MAG: enolase C-terminal domain-like protein [Planctomycetota bacterium]